MDKKCTCDISQLMFGDGCICGAIPGKAVPPKAEEDVARVVDKAGAIEDIKNRGFGSGPTGVWRVRDSTTNTGPTGVWRARDSTTSTGPIYCLYRCPKCNLEVLLPDTGGKKTCASCGVGMLNKGVWV